MAKTSKKDQKSLFKAVENNDISKLRILLQKDINLNARNEDGDTALRLAVMFDRIKVENKLLEMGADPNIQNKDGKTALIWAAQNGYTETVVNLLEKGADPNYGYTVLMWDTNKEIRKLIEDKVNNVENFVTTIYKNRKTAFVDDDKFTNAVHSQLTKRKLLLENYDKEKLKQSCVEARVEIQKYRDNTSGFVKTMYKFLQKIGIVKFTPDQNIIKRLAKNCLSIVPEKPAMVEEKKEEKREQEKKIIIDEGKKEGKIEQIKGLLTASDKKIAEQKPQKKVVEKNDSVLYIPEDMRINTSVKTLEDLAKSVKKTAEEIGKNTKNDANKSMRLNQIKKTFDEFKEQTSKDQLPNTSHMTGKPSQQR